MRAPNWSEGLRKPSCGCAERKFIMFEAGRLGMWQAAIMVAAAAAVLYVGVRK